MLEDYEAGKLGSWDAGRPDSGEAGVPGGTVNTKRFVPAPYHLGNFLLQDINLAGGRV